MVSPFVLYFIVHAVLGEVWGHTFCGGADTASDNKLGVGGILVASQFTERHSGASDVTHNCFGVTWARG